MDPKPQMGICIMTGPELPDTLPMSTNRVIELNGGD